MENTHTVLQLPHSTILIRQIDQVQGFVKDTLLDAKREIGERVSYFKDGLTNKLHKTGVYINGLVLPVNNFIKDVRQIEEEFEAERINNSEYCICLAGEMVPASEVLKMDMEENY
jgi:hypothetical protein